MFGSVVLQVVFGAGAVITPLLTKSFFDDALPLQQVDKLQVLVIGVAAVGLVSAVVGMLSRLLSVHVGSRISVDVGLRFFNHLQHLPIRFFEGHGGPEVVTRFQDLNRSILFVTSTLHTLGAVLLFVIAIPPLLLLLNWKLALFALATTPLSAGLAVATGRLVRQRTMDSLERAAQASAYQVEALNNIAYFKASGAEGEVYGSMRTRMIRLREAQLRAGNLTALLGGGISAIRAAGAALFSFFAWSLLMRNELTMGEFIAFSAYMGYLNSPMQQVTSLFNGLQQAAASLHRVFEYFDATCEQDPDGSIAPRAFTRSTLSGAVRFEDVSFAYAPERDLLRSIDMALEPGTVTAIVGGSGEGKSTLAKLLLRMYEPSRGTIWFGDVRATQLELYEIRRNISVVWQETHLLRGTLRENLLFGAPVQRPDLNKILDAAGLTEFVQGLPRGLETEISELGANISAGQRARIAIARALVRPSTILVLDEATANLDPQNETAIIEGIIGSALRRTVLLITHHPRVATRADFVFVLQNGQLWGGKSHEQLLLENADYGRIWRQQPTREKWADPVRGMDHHSGTQPLSVDSKAVREFHL